MSHHSEEILRYRFILSVVAGIVILLELLFDFIGITVLASHILDYVLLIVLIIPVAFSAIKEFKEHPFNIDSLMTVAAISATWIGAIHEALLVLILFNFAEYVEEKTTDKLRKTVHEFSKIIPKKTYKYENGRLVEVDVNELIIGDEILIKPGQRVPVDGVILQGETAIDVSTITGESIPIDVKPGDQVLSGSINITNSIRVKVIKPFKDSTVSRIMQLVLEAQERKAKIERFIDSFSVVYTPIVLILAIATVLIPVLIFSQSFKLWLYRSSILIVLACPSAFIISTPITYFVGLTRAMKSGLIIKGSIYLETLSKVNAMAFDKTGTLTENRLVVKQVIPINSSNEKEVLKLAALLETHSNHPIARAIVDKAVRENINLDSDNIRTVEELPGLGLRAIIDDVGEIVIGNERILTKLDIKFSSEEHSSLVRESKIVYVARNGEVIGLIEIEDVLRKTAVEAINELYKLGLLHLIMLTGDNKPVARKIAKKLGIKEYCANLLPEDKVRIVRELKRQYNYVSMVGDGINDAPALAVSDVGIAIGTAGNDIAIESADVAVMSDDLRRIPYLIRLSRKVQLKLKMNLILAFSLKLLLMALGLLGFIPLLIAVLGDDGLTLLIIGNTVPILKYEEKL